MNRTSKLLLTFSLIAILLITGLLFFRAHLRIVVNISMEPTIHPDDMVYFRKERVVRNSIIIIADPMRGEIIKRVTGIPGDYIVDMVDSLVLLNQQNANLNKINNPAFYKSVIPKGYYYVRGDNSNRSYDSRHFGLVSEDQIVGVMVFKINGHETSSKRSKYFSDR